MRRRYRGTLSLALLLALWGRGCSCESEKKAPERPAETSSSSASSRGCGGEPSGGSGGGCGAGDLSGDGGCLFCDDDTRSVFEAAPWTPPDTAPYSCINPFAGSLACEAPVERIGKKVCNDAMLSALSSCFVGDAKGCYAARDAYAACATCVLDDTADGGVPVGWIEGNWIDEGACIRAIDPKSACATVVNCTRACIESACVDCADGSEWNECRDEVLAPTTLALPDAGPDADADVDTDADAGGGVCHRLIARQWTACASDPRFRPCIIQTVDDLLPFFRGACRDGADWARAYIADGTGDAGPDGD